jgi:hypothetical protein
LEDTTLLQYDREELYQKVWEKPMLKVAEEYGVSSVALGKTCVKLSIPLPGRGHWAKLAHGHAGAEKPQLPKLNKVPVIYRSSAAQRKPANSSQTDAEFGTINQLLASGALTLPQIDSAARPHPLIRLTASGLRSLSRKDEFGILLPREQGGLDVKVSAATLDRALHVMAQVIAVLGSQGHKVDVSDEGKTVALVNGEQVRFAIEEPVRKVVTSKPRVPNPTDRWDYDEIVTHEPSGKLVLTILSGIWGQFEQRKRWSDGKTQRLEGLIANFVAGLLRTAVNLRRQEEERKRRDAEQKKREQERFQLQKDVQEEEKKLERLNKLVEDWERANRMRRFIAAYAEQTGVSPSEEQSEDKAWIEWAFQQADRIDPLVIEKPASVLDRKHEIRWW